MIKRKIFKELLNHLSMKKITLITGPRQAGKTTLMDMLRKNLEQKGEKTLYLNLDVEWDKPFFISHSSFVNKLKLEKGE